MARVKEVVKRGTVTVDINDKVANIAKAMAENEIAAVLVTHEEKIVGIITERDLVRKVLASNNSTEVVAGMCMSTPVISIDPDSPLSEAARTMSSNKVRRLAVIKDGKLDGIITASDVARHLANLASHTDPFLNAMARRAPPRGVHS